MNKKAILSLLSKLKNNIADIELLLSDESIDKKETVEDSNRHDNCESLNDNELIMDSNRYDEYCSWYLKSNDNTFGSLRSILSRIKIVEKTLDVDLTRLPLQKFDSLINSITKELLSDKAKSTIVHYKGAVRSYYKYRTNSGGK